MSVSFTRGASYEYILTVAGLRSPTYPAPWGPDVSGRPVCTITNSKLSELFLLTDTNLGRFKCGHDKYPYNVQPRSTCFYASCES